MTGSPSRPRSVLLGRYDGAGRVRYVGRSTALAGPLTERLSRLLTPASGGHPWEGRRFSAAWGSRDPLVVDLVQPEVVVEVAADISCDAAGRYRHPVRIVRDRPDLSPGDVATLPDPSADPDRSTRHPGVTTTKAAPLWVAQVC